MSYPTRDDIQREKNLNDLKFSYISDDLIAEYLDLHQKKSELEQEHQLSVQDLIEKHKQKDKLILIDLGANRKKMEEMSGLDGFELTKRLPPKRDIEPPF